MEGLSAADLYGRSRDSGRGIEWYYKEGKAAKKVCVPDPAAAAVPEDESRAEALKYEVNDLPPNYPREGVKKLGYLCSKDHHSLLMSLVITLGIISSQRLFHVLVSHKHTEGKMMV